jgi:exopolysaccharide biosynthesis polyprenyl glycosylphosphotransferase
MLKSNARTVATTFFVADLLVTILSFVAAYAITSEPNHFFGMLLPLNEYLWLLLFIVPVWAILLQFGGTYRSHRIESLFVDAGYVSRAAILGGISLFAFVGLTKSGYISRPFLAIFTVIDVIVLVLMRVTVRSMAWFARSRGLNTRSILIVGTGDGARAHAHRIAENRQWGYRLVGFISEGSPAASAVPADQIIGNLKTIRRVLREYVVDEVVVALPTRHLESLDSVLLGCEEMGVKTRLALDFFPNQIARVEVEQMNDCPMLTFSTTPPEGPSTAIKRAMDVVFSGLFLLTFSWLYLLIAFMIKATSRGPVLFCQERVGMNGRRFTFYKFRSMVVDADRRKAELQHLNEMDGPVFKIKNDPRVTRVGRFLRKFSLDELPQMWNVFTGDMSLVGPRPPVPAEVEKYESWARRRLSVRPGLTCLWQISGRNNINFNEWMELDLAYIDNWTLGLDVEILIKTVPAVLGGRGAS